MHRMGHLSIVAAAATVLAGLAGSSVNANTLTPLDQSTFMAQSGFASDSSRYAYNDFSGYTSNEALTTPITPAGANGFSATYTGALWSGNTPGSLTTSSVLDAITVTFSGSPVTAIGGNFWGSDVLGNKLDGTPLSITIHYSGGAGDDTFTNTGSQFAGIIGPNAIQSLTINSAGGYWPSLQDLYFGTALRTGGGNQEGGSAVPLPGAASMGLPLIGALGLWARKRKAQQA